jgi:hypothetical protein
MPWQHATGEFVHLHGFKEWCPMCPDHPEGTLVRQESDADGSKMTDCEDRWCSFLLPSHSSQVVHNRYIVTVVKL